MVFKTAAILIVISLLCCTAGLADPKYSFYGDSITYGYDLPTPDDFFGHQMIIAHDPTATWDHNLDGNGWASEDCWKNISSHYSPGTDFFIVMCSNNDIRHNLNGTETAVNLYRIYEYVKTNGGVPVILMQTLEDPSIRGDSSGNITITETVLAENNIPFIRMYNAINTSCLGEGVHPDLGCHKLMGDYLWKHLPFGTFDTITTTYKRTFHISSVR